MSKSRILELDIVRAAAIILIVFSHLPPINGLPIDPVIKYWSAIIGVSLFLLISGIVLSPPKDIKSFYKKRALRIYPAYLVVMAVYVLIQYTHPNIANTLGIYLTPIEILINVLGLQALLNVPSYGVLWFVGLIVVYYMLYPFLGTEPKKVIAFSVAAFVLFICLHQFGLIIPQLIYYWPVFIAGILLRGRIPSRLNMSKKLKPVLFIAGASYWIYLTHMLVIGAIVLLLSSASVAPIVVNNNTPSLTPSLTPSNVIKNVTKAHYILYIFVMSAPCPEGIRTQEEVTAWAKAHPSVEYHIEDADGPLGVKYDSHLAPTTVMLKDGKMVGRWVGIFNVSNLDDVLNAR